MVAEKDAMILGAEPNQRRRDAFEFLGTAFSGKDIVPEGLEDCKAMDWLMPRISALAWSVQTIR